jgi:hypothetical protein
MNNTETGIREIGCKTGRLAELTGSYLMAGFRLLEVYYDTVAGT